MKSAEIGILLDMTLPGIRPRPLRNPWHLAGYPDHYTTAYTQMAVNAVGVQQSWEFIRKPTTSLTS
jgi:hypothetical protein